MLLELEVLRWRDDGLSDASWVWAGSTKPTAVLESCAFSRIR